MTSSAPTGPPVAPAVPDWDNTARWIRTVHGPQRLERLLLTADRLRSGHRDAYGSLDNTWQRLGVAIQRVNLPPNVSGLCTQAERGVRNVVVNINDDHRRQNFTIAHEVAHLLLGGAPGPDHTEEAWCDRFAARLLCDPQHLRAAIGDPAQIRPETVRAAAARLGLSLSATVVALRNIPLPDTTAVMLIRRYRHRTTAADAPRIAVSASPSIFIPADRRLRRIGMINLADYTDLVHTRGVRPDTTNTLDDTLEPPPNLNYGHDHLSAIRATFDGKRRPAMGPADWSAVAGGRSDMRYVIAVVTFELAIDATRTSRRLLSGGSRTAAKNLGQLRLDQTP